MEASGQRPQLVHARRALMQLNIPIHMIHGDKDDFAPIEVAERLAAETVTRQPIHFVRTAGANHFLNDGPAEQLIAALEACIPAKKPWFAWPDLSKLLLPYQLGLGARRLRDLQAGNARWTTFADIEGNEFDLVAG